MAELIRIEVPEPVTLKSQQPDGSTEDIRYTFEQYIIYLINRGTKRFNSNGKGIRSSISIVKATEVMKEEAKANEGEEDYQMLFIVDQEDWKELMEESEEPENGYPFSQFGLAARNFASFMDTLKEAKERMKEREKKEKELAEAEKAKALPPAEKEEEPDAEEEKE